jgi:hypothetical protein
MPSRREFAIGVSGGLTTLLAGCIEPFDGGGQNDELDASTYTDWIPASIVPEDETALDIGLFRPDILSAVADVDTPTPGEDFLAGTDLSEIQIAAPITVETENDEGVRKMQDVVRLFFGEFEGDAVRANYEQEHDVEEAGSYDEFDLYTLDSGELLAIRDGRALLSEDRSELESCIDAASGAESRLVETNEDFERVADEIGVPGYGAFAFDTEELGASAAGLGFSVADGVSSAHHVFVYDTEADARDHEQNVHVQNLLASLSNTEVTTEGRLLHLTGLTETRTLLSYSSSNPNPPVARLDAEYDTETGVVRVTHGEGDAIEAEELAVYGSGVDDAYRTTFAQFPGDEFDSEETFDEGESIEIPVDETGYQVVLLWESADGSTSSILLVFEGPDE